MNIDVFRRVIIKYTIRIWIPIVILFLLIQLNTFFGHNVLGNIKWNIFGLPVISTDSTLNYTGFSGFGIVSIGGVAIGLVAIGGTALGLLAFGGGAIGLIAIGGGSIGIIAIGGGSIGIIAFGGGAYGYYVLAGGGCGKHVLSYKRQDAEAVRFFCKYMPDLKKAFVSE